MSVCVRERARNKGALGRRNALGRGSHEEKVLRVLGPRDGERLVVAWWRSLHAHEDLENCIDSRRAIDLDMARRCIGELEVHLGE